MEGKQLKVGGAVYGPTHLAPSAPLWTPNVPESRPLSSFGSLKDLEQTLKKRRTLLLDEIRKLNSELEEIEKALAGFKMPAPE